AERREPQGKDPEQACRRTPGRGRAGAGQHKEERDEQQQTAEDQLTHGAGSLEVGCGESTMRNGGMAEWRNGGMAEWRNGGMAEWRNERMGRKEKGRALRLTANRRRQTTD